MTVTETLVNSATFTRTYTPTRTVTDTYTYTATRTYTQTVTETSTDLPTNTFTFTSTVTPTFTETYTVSFTPTVTATMPPFPYLIEIGVYNEAGELVRTIAMSPVSSALTTATFSAGTNLDPNTLIPGEPLNIYLAGMNTPDNIGSAGTVFQWDGKTDAAQDVASGKYYIKITQRDTYDHTTVFIKDFAVLHAEEYVEMNIYNSAGELIRTIRHSTVPPAKLELKTEDVMIVEKTGSDITINYGPGLTDYLKWDGKNNQGVAVTSGAYEIQLTTKTMSGTVAFAAKTVQILSEGNSYMGDIKAYPNPYLNIGRLTFTWSGFGVGDMSVNIHNINGELIKSVHGRVENGSVTWDGKTAGGSRASQGYYICIFKAKNFDGYVEQKRLKIVLLGD